MTLLAEERQQLILQQLEETGKVKVIPLAQQLEVSNETIRRDLDALEEQRKLKRVYGGAVKLTHFDGEPSYTMRRKLNQEGKQAIGREAARLLQDGDTVFMDTGTTVLEMTRWLAGKKNITIVTNSLPAASALLQALSLEQFTGKVILLGGEISVQQQSVSGILAHELLKQFTLDKAFLSVGGISPAQGITDYDMNESLVSRLAAGQASEVILLADHSKIGSTAFCQIAPLHTADVIISDQELPGGWKEELERIGVAWIRS
ncbi:DeoR/GlpR family DNA-binding transcription regulator [Paenibacillus riograndensis]|uniref:Transcriptional regulator n=2 Tax=Paenibacillus riograndensis TaxID=483937 RepID=A0A0E4HEI2_9BACL|nr:DeoR/GlpR family DNA-binding transcription regulator [Paenibacillus riograndensis]CQR56022.1 transcriptional regulator [Paenibacillus riograndensis SBR5]